LAINNRTGTVNEQDSQHYFGENMTGIDLVDCNIDLDSKGSKAKAVPVLM